MPVRQIEAKSVKTCFETVRGVLGSCGGFGGCGLPVSRGAEAAVAIGLLLVIRQTGRTAPTGAFLLYA